MPDFRPEPEGTGSPAASSQRRRLIWPWIIAGTVLTFALGLIGSPWFESRFRSALPAVLQEAHVELARLEAIEARVAQLEAHQNVPPPASVSVMAVGPVIGRIDALEARAAALQASDAAVATRIAQLVAQAGDTRRAVTTGDRQIRDLFLLGVARRMVELGRPLGQVGLLLDARFRATDQAASEALAAWSLVPQTRPTLAARLEGMSLAADVPAKGWWERVKVRLSSLVTVRGNGAAAAAGTSAGLPGARTALASGDLALAVSRLEQAPNTRDRDQWLADARALLAAEAALDRLEQAALAVPGTAVAATGPGGTP